MKKHIAEDLPSRPHPQASLSAKPQSGGAGGGDGGRPEKKDSDKESESTPDKRIRQAVYDIKYRARRENIPLRSAYSQYMQNSSMSEMEKSEVRKRLFGGEGGVQSENFEFEMKDFASRSMAGALYKVFVEKRNYIDETQLRTEIQEAQFSKDPQKKYKVTVFDPKNEVSYVRYATREKINELRSKGLKVEFTEYGTPYEGEKEKGEQTSKALGGGGGKKAKKDYDGDGKIESPAKEHAGAVHNAIRKATGGVPDGKDTSSVKESYLSEISALTNLQQTDSPEYVNPNANQTQIDVSNKRNKVVVNPQQQRTPNASISYNNALFAHTELDGELISENGYSRFLKLLQEKKMTSAKKKKEKKLKKKYDKSGMKASMQQQYGAEKGKKVYFATIRKQAMKEDSDCGCEDNKEKEEKLKCKDDKRSVPTSVSLAKTKFQAMGEKNPLVMMAAS